MQGQSVKTGGKEPPAKMKISQLDARAGRLRKLGDDRIARPAIRKAAGDHIGDRQAGEDREGDDDSQPVLQTEFAFRSVQGCVDRARLMASLRLIQFRSSISILCRPATSWSGR